jgi:hypothetical protein
MHRHDELIKSLSHELAPVPRPPNVGALAGAWVLASAVYVVFMTKLLGPVRPGALSQLISEPRFLLETLLGVLSIAWIGLVAFRAAVPAALTRKFAAAGFVLMALWLAQYVVGLVNPSLEPSTLGKRGYCFIETLAYAVPPILAALFFIRRLYPLNYIRTAMSVGLAAGMIPALYMQLACMYEPVHILGLHVLPGLAMVLFAAGVAALWRLRVNSEFRRERRNPVA